MSEKVQLKTKILELSETNNIYMTSKLCILADDVNANGAHFTEDYIDGIVANKDKYVGIPLVVNRSKLEGSEYNSLTHELKDNQLKTDIIGSFVDFWKETDDEGTPMLMGESRIHKRYPNVCKAVLDLYSTGDLEFSCEVLLSAYDVNNGIRTIDYEDGKNPLIGSCIVSNAAEQRSRAFLLIAEALSKDVVESVEGGEDKVEKDNKGEIAVFNKGNSIRYHLENSELSYDQIRDQAYDILNPMDDVKGYRDYNYWISDVYSTYLVAVDWDNSSEGHKINYTVTDNTLNLDAKENWIEVEYKWVPKNTDSELNSIIVAQKEEVVNLEENVEQLKTEIAELQEYKAKWETAEKQKKQAELSEKYSKLLSEDTFNSDRVKSAIEDVNELLLNEIVVEEVAKEKESASVETAESKNKVTTFAKQQGDLLPTDAKARWYGKRN